MCNLRIAQVGLLVLLGRVGSAAEPLEIIGDKRTVTVVASPFKARVPNEHDLYFWHATPGLTRLGGTRIADVEAPDGEYGIYCVGVSWQAQIPKYVNYSALVRVGSNGNPPPPPPPPEYKEFEDAARRVPADAIGVAAMVQIFETFLRSADPQETQPQLEKQLTGEIAYYMLKTGKGRQAGWWKWRKGISDLQIKFKLDASVKYLAAMQAVLKGLRSAESSEQTGEVKSGSDSPPRFMPFPSKMSAPGSFSKQSAVRNPQPITYRVLPQPARGVYYVSPDTYCPT